MHQYNDRLDDLSPESYKKRLFMSLSFLGFVREFQKNFTEHNDAINLEVLESELVTFVDGFFYDG